MTKHMIGTREDWLAARLGLFEAERELTRRGDELTLRDPCRPLGDGGLVHGGDHGVLLRTR